MKADPKLAREWRKNNRDKIDAYLIEKHKDINWVNRQRLTARKGLAHRRGISFELDIKWFNEHYSKGCALTGIPFREIEYIPKQKSGPKSPYTVSIDRINSSKGYTKENSQLILCSMNQFKGEFPIDEIKHIAEEFLNHENTQKLNRIKT